MIYASSENSGTVYVINGTSDNQTQAKVPFKVKINLLCINSRIVLDHQVEIGL